MSTVESMLSRQEFLTSDEACAALGVKLSTLYAYVSRGKLRSYRLGSRRQRFYSARELRAMAGTMPELKDSSGRVPLAADWISYV